MKSEKLFIVLLALVVSSAMIGCDGGSSAPVMIDPPAPAPEPEPEPPVDFTAFVIDQFDATADNTDPQPVDDTDFTFNDEENPDAFSSLLSDP